MKHRMLSARSLGVTSTILLSVALVSTTTAEPSIPVGDTNAAPTPHDLNVSQQAQLAPTAPTPDTDAPAQLVSDKKPLPSNIRPSSPVAEVVKLANSGLDESVMMAFVTNSTHTFNLGAEEIIYLNDIGVPGSVVTAMILRDESLKTMLAIAAAGPAPAEPQPSSIAPPDAMQLAAGPPPPDQVPPQPGDAGQGYPAEAPLTPPDAGAEEMFYDSLAPYGNWVDVGGYGRCWQPTVVVVNSGWQPYFDCGRWLYSDCGWYWCSDYSWGWAPFHYGSWFRHARLGWCWVPGRTWGPSWVSWRYNDHFCGWAPLPPGASFAVGGGLVFHGRHVGEGDDFGLRPGHYRFVAWDHFNDRQLRPRSVPSSEAHRIFDTTTVATRITGDGHNVINNGLPVSRVAAATHRPVHTVALRASSQPAVLGGRAERFDGGGQVLSVYRPTPESGTRHGTHEPAKSSTVATIGSTSTRLVPPPAAPWSPRIGSTTGTSVQTPTRTEPLVIRGPQSAAKRETPPPNSLVVIGRGTGNRYAPSAPSAPFAASARPAPSANVALQAGEAEQRPALDAAAAAQRNWMGTVSSSPQPSWFAGGEGAAATRPTGATPMPRPQAPAYQPTMRSAGAPQQVPRYAPAQTYIPQRSYSPPAFAAPSRTQSFESRPAPSAPPAVSAPVARSSPPQQSSSRNGR